MEKDFVELSKKWFDKQAPIYDETNTILYSKYGKKSCKNIYDFLKGKEYQKLLDIGCGTGYLISMLSKDYNAEYIGLDLSPEMINQAIRKNIKNARFAPQTILPSSTTSFTPSLIPIIVRVAIIIVVILVAKPSIPSVRFTAFVVPSITKIANGIYNNTGSVIYCFIIGI